MFYNVLASSYQDAEVVGLLDASHKRNPRETAEKNH